jgi:uncharacterized protein YraI/beta-lactamase class A
MPALAQNTSVTAEAIGQANLRAYTDTSAPLLGEIRVGTRYPVIGRSALYPWVLLGDVTTRQPIGWAFRELLTLQGDINTVPVTEVDLGDTVSPVIAPTPTLAQPSVSATPNAQTTVAPTQAPIDSSVRGIVQGEINIRYGPGVEYPRVGIGVVGDVLSIAGWHTLLPWVQIRYPQSPTGAAWVNIDLIQIEGDLYALPAISQTTFNFPTLTPTPSGVRAADILGATPVPLSAEFLALGEVLTRMMLEAGFDPATSRLGAMFVMNLQTGETLSYGGEIAFSGMSVNKIAILTTLFDQFNAPPDDQTAYTIGDAMICSQNISTNRMLTVAGDGNPYTGAERVSAFLERIGLQNTFIYTPFADDPFITPQAPRTRTTNADQSAAEPDPFNQMTVDEVGGLLNSVYQCSANNTGPLIEGGTFNQTECRQMLHVMSGNRIGNLIEAGVPATVQIAHKHGWIDDTHGDAALVFSPGGAYIFVVVLHNPIYLLYEESSPLIAEMSRTIYNYFNPDTPMQEIRYEQVPATCNLLGSPIIADLQDPMFGQ